MNRLRIILLKIINLIYKLPYFLGFILVRDMYRYIRYKRWKEFNGWGLHCFIGRFGSSKTLSLTREAYKIAKRYPQVTFLCNYKLNNFPKHTIIIPLVHWQQIIDAPPNTVIMIDELATWFNSRDWSKFPPTLMQQILQCRKKKKMLLTTVQVWEHCDKQIRDIAFTVRDCKMYFKRWSWIDVYDAVDYSNRTAVINKPEPIAWYNYIALDRDFNRYDTDELVEKFSEMEYLSTAEIEAKRGAEQIVNITNLVKKR